MTFNLVDKKDTIIIRYNDPTKSYDAYRTGRDNPTTKEEGHRSVKQG